MSREALGLIETKGMLGAIEVTRAATQAAEVSIASAEHTESGRVIVKIEGNWETVVVAVEAGARAAEQANQLVSIHVIPRPDEMVSPILPYQLFIDRYYPSGDSPAQDKPKSKKVPASREQRPSSHTTTPATPIAPKHKPARKPVSKPKIARSHTPTPTLTVQQSTDSIIQSETHVQAATESAPTFSELEALPVVKLRQYARTLTNLPIQGRQISMANKQQLLEAIKATL